MAIDSQHPFYSAFLLDWQLMRDLYSGERTVKAEGKKYLPPTAGMILDGMDSAKQQGFIDYEAYKQRAVFHDFVADAVEALVGLLHMKPANIELPTMMEPLRDRATISNESLLQLLRRINEQQLVTGRVGILGDMPVSPDPANPMPYIALYVAETITNWDDGTAIDGVNNLNLVVLNESGVKREQSFEWVAMKKFRVLQLGLLDVNEPEGSGSVVYSQGIYEDDLNYSAEHQFVPVLRGSSLEEIPFVFINSKDTVATPDKPPLLGLGNLTLAIYRGEADYRQNLYMQSQDTLVVIGGIVSDVADENGASEGLRVGAGARIDLDIGGDAKYIGVTANGLPEQRMAIDGDKKQAMLKSAQFISANSTQVESGESMKTRIAAQTATLYKIALTGAAGLEQLLKILARWMGANPDEVKVTPNTEFTELDIDADALVKLMTARSMGAPLSLESIHQMLVERKMTSKSFEEEKDAMGEEDVPPGGTGAPGDPNALPGTKTAPGKQQPTKEPGNKPQPVKNNAN